MAEAEREERLASMMADIQARWGERALVSAREAPRQGVLPTGTPELDILLEPIDDPAAPGAQAPRVRAPARATPAARGRARAVQAPPLPRGGFPRGHLTELIGSGTAGHLVAAARALAQAQRERQHTMYIDIGGQVDVAALARCGVYLDELAILRAADLPQGLAMTTDLLRAGFGGAALFDRVHDFRTLGNPEHLASLQMAVREWAPLLGRSAAVLLVVTETAVPGEYAEGLPLPFAADVRLLFEHQRWAAQRRQIVGYTTRVSVIKSRSGAQGGRTSLSISLV